MVPLGEALPQLVGLPVDADVPASLAATAQPANEAGRSATTGGPTSWGRDPVRTVENILAAGRELIEAKAALGHGRFEAMVTDELGMSPSTAQRFMAVAGHPLLSNAAHVRLLPPSWGTLAELSRLPEADLTAAIAAHEVRPDMERREALQLVRRYLDGEEGPPADGPSAAPRRKSLPDALTAAGWELDKAVERLQKLTGDDRFPHHRDQASARLSAHLARAVETCQGLLDQLATTNPNKENQ